MVMFLSQNFLPLLKGAISWAGSFVDAISGNSFLLAFVLVSFVGLGVGLIKRIIRL